MFRHVLDLSCFDWKDDLGETSPKGMTTPTKLHPVDGGVLCRTFSFRFCKLYQRFSWKTSKEKPGFFKHQDSKSGETSASGFQGPDPDPTPLEGPWV